MSTEVKAPALYDGSNKVMIFLAGSIEMGAAEMWQDTVVKKINDPDVLFLNPRRDDWDASWKQDINDPQFNQQVNWELSSMTDAHLILFYFAPGTKSPISLLELGLWANTEKYVLVCCPKDFWRKGNVDIVCDKYGIKVYDDLNEMLATLGGSIDFIKPYVLTKN